MTKALTRLQTHSDAQFATYDLDARSDEADDLRAFIAISAELVGFSVAELLATGNAQHLFEEFGTTVGVAIRREFLDTELKPEDRLEDAFCGPLARNVMRLWYLGQWRRLPDDWVHALTPTLGPFDEFGRNYNRVVSPQAYREGLVWPAVGAHPPAAKQPGFGSWSEPPR